MITLTLMSIPEFLNKKFLEWQYQEEHRKTIKEFAALFGASKSLMGMWLNGTRSPGPEYKESIIERYGEEAILAFGENPDMYAIIKMLENAEVDEIRSWREIIVKKSLEENATKRTSTKRRTRTVE